MTKSRGDIRRGDLFWIDWSPACGSEQAGIWPGLIIQTDAANRNERFPNTMVAAVSRSGRSVPSHVRVEPSPENGLREPSFVKCEQVQAITKGRLRDRIGHLADEDMASVAEGLRRMMDLS